jgi:hypothetical protein
LRLSQPPIFRPLSFTVMFICAEVSLTAPVYESVPVESDFPGAGHRHFSRALHGPRGFRAALREIRVRATPVGARGWPRPLLAVQTFEVCAGIFIGIPSITVCDVVSHKTPG